MVAFVFAVAAFLFAVLNPARPAVAQTPPSPPLSPIASPSANPPEAAAAPRMCLARLDYLVALDPDRTGNARSYLLTLAPLSGQPGLVSGTVSLYDAANRWDIAIGGAVAAGTGESPNPTVVIVRFTEAHHLDVGRVAALAGPEGGRCVPVSTAAIASVPPADQFGARLLSLVGSATRIDASQPVSDPAPACGRPNAPARLTKKTFPVFPDIAAEQGISGKVSFRVTLADDGSIVATTIVRSSGFQVLDDSAFQAAINSKYAAGTQGCRTVGGVYPFVAGFFVR